MISTLHCDFNITLHDFNITLHAQRSVIELFHTNEILDEDSSQLTILQIANQQIIL